MFSTTNHFLKFLFLNVMLLTKRGKSKTTRNAFRILQRRKIVKVKIISLSYLNIWSIRVKCTLRLWFGQFSKSFSFRYYSKYYHSSSQLVLSSFKHKYQFFSWILFLVIHIFCSRIFQFKRLLLWQWMSFYYCSKVLQICIHFSNWSLKS